MQPGTAFALQFMKNLIQPIQGQSRALAFGLDWQTVLGENLDQLADQVAKRQRASYYTRGGSRSTVVGLLTLSRAQRKEFERLELYSAAAAFARARPQGVVAIRWNVPNGVWVAAASDGVVLTGTDVIFDSEEEAQEALDELRSRYPDLTVFGDAEGERKLSTQLLLDQLDTATKLKNAKRVVARIPAPVWVVVAMIGLWMIADYAWEWYDAREVSRRKAELSIEHIDPVAEWSKTLNSWSRSVPQHSTEDFKAILASIGEVPVTAGRWELVEITCSFVGRSCNAQYQRTHLADNLSLIRSLPGHWSVRFLDLHNASASWSIDGLQPQTLATTELPSDSEVETYWASMYQRLAPALTDIGLSKATRVGIDPPIYSRSDGRAVAVPFPEGSSLKHPLERELVMNGPLRSLFLLNFPSSASLNTLHVRRAPTSQADIANSVLIANLTGKIYVH